MDDIIILIILAVYGVWGYRLMGRVGGFMEKNFKRGEPESGAEKEKRTDAPRSAAKARAALKRRESAGTRDDDMP